MRNANEIWVIKKKEKKLFVFCCKLKKREASLELFLIRRELCVVLGRKLSFKPFYSFQELFQHKKVVKEKVLSHWRSINRFMKLWNYLIFTQGNHLIFSNAEHDKWFENLPQMIKLWQIHNLKPNNPCHFIIQTPPYPNSSLRALK